MAVQQGRSELRGSTYSAPYVEPLSDARTPLADIFRILLELVRERRSQSSSQGIGHHINM